MKPAVEPAHGSIVYTVDGLVAQALGLPHPPELVPVVPKYLVCRESVWARGSLAFCRTLAEYGPRGLAEALARSGFVEKLDGVYGAPLPYVENWRILQVVEPREALWRRLSRPRGSALDSSLLEVLDVLRDYGLNLAELGLTGSLAAEIENPDVSDVDLVVYGSAAAERVLEVFEAIQPAGVFEKTSIGGLVVNPPLDLRWRRARILGREVSWVGVPLEGELCQPLDGYYGVPRPSSLVELEVEIEPYQKSSLTYPPCVETSSRQTLVSFEYNVAVLLYRGGRFRVRGVADEDGAVVYLGVREAPGEITLVQRRG